LRSFFGVFGLDESSQVVEAHAPEAAVLLEPGIDCAEGFGIELVDAMTAFTVLADEMGATQQAQMFRDRRTRDGKSLSNVSGGLAAAAQEVEDGSAGRIGERLEGSFSRLGW
jgi:hypothetical protein